MIKLQEVVIGDWLELGLALGLG